MTGKFKAKVKLASKRVKCLEVQSEMKFLIEECEDFSVCNISFHWSENLVGKCVAPFYFNQMILWVFVQHPNTQ